MATNLRLEPHTAERLRECAERLGRSQQSLLREAVEAFLATQDARDEEVEAQVRELGRFGRVWRPAGWRPQAPTPTSEWVPGPTTDSEINAMIREGCVTHMPRVDPSRRVSPVPLPPGMTTQQLLDELRAERI